ncbi:hypothetical protein J7E96_20725 [Streptomyces sp. ISL-96]|uniref:hypothetical protein n=1 Tax=Streptomyces sp. ISL-96 TaxID=2819191 RepID=UPI001BEB9761|nr:hypothetical protein [Streptomyces sp. ISL-96]MBT2490895.1 hypothetical protein [Streptomyces sp. ISL-96]
MEASDGSDLPEGSPVPAAKRLVEGRELRAISPYPVWDPALYAGGFWALLLSLLALGIAMIGVGTVMTIILAVVAFLSPGLAWVNAAGVRKEYLDSLLLTSVATPAGSAAEEGLDDGDGAGCQGRR